MSNKEGKNAKRIPVKIDIKIDDIEYTRDELANVVKNAIIEQLNDDIYKYQPEDTDNFYTDYKILPVIK